ncbi:MAG: exodeoxyribonuclease VII large subunit, partial [Saprospiraceae bacterium]
MTLHTLFDLNEHIRRVMALNFQQPLWIAAEIAQLGRSRGHCYLQLVQKGEGDQLVAQSAAVLWAQDHRRLSKTLGAQLDAVLQEGLEVKMCVRVDFHEQYGLKLHITDLDPSHTLGQLERQRRQTIETL